jgi:hypothetical protein
VAGLRRDQIVMLNLATSPVTVSSWATTRYQQQCSTSFATYMRDVDVSPDGSWFVVATTGAYRAGSLCDTAARWEIGATGPGQQPTWADYTGGDNTLYSRAVTGTAVYVGGHQRWMNNSFAADRAGPARLPEPRTGTLPGDLFRIGLDGAMTRSPFDGTTAGPPSPVATGVDWSTVTGMTMASGRLLYASSTGTLSAVDFSGGLPTGPATVVSGPATDGQSWQSRALFVLNPAN